MCASSYPQSGTESSGLQLDLHPYLLAPPPRAPRVLLTRCCGRPDRHTRDPIACSQRSTTQTTLRSPAPLTSTVLGQLQAPAPPHPHPQVCPSIGQAVGYSEPGFVPVSCWPPCQPGAGAGTDLIWQLRKRVVGTGWGEGEGDKTPIPEGNKQPQALSRMGET